MTNPIPTSLLLTLLLTLPACTNRTPTTDDQPTDTQQPTATTDTPQPDAEGFIPLLRDDHADAWKQAGPGGFNVENGVATSYGGMGLWWYQPLTFRNFTLSLEFRQNAISANSGVFVRFPDPGDDPWVAVRQGYEIQIMGNRPTDKHTGAIYDFQAPESVPLKPAGEWNEMEITVIGQHYRVSLNGQPITTFTGDRSERGHIGLQNHDNNSRVAFRNIRVKPLPDNPDEN
jgi:hypothetical protein